MGWITCSKNIKNMCLGEANALHPKIDLTKSKKGLWILGLFLLLSACYGGIPGKVVDAETGKPIEGAVVLVEWDIIKGFGLSYTERYKVFETVTNEDGWFTFPGVLNPLVNSPNLVIYKKGYFGWREDYTFPDYREKHFRWTSGCVFRLERFVRGCLHNRHLSFIGGGIGSLGEVASKLDQAASWERLLAQKESRLYGKKLKRLPPDWKSYDQYTIEGLQKQIWKEVAQELYFSKES